MNEIDIRKSFTIHLGLDATRFSRLETDARSHGMHVIELNLESIHNGRELGEYLAGVFKFPHATSGLDAAVDMISDLEWIGCESGYLIIARGTREPSLAADSFVSILPNIVDRWRSQAVPFVVAIDGKGEQLQAALLAANREMERAGNLPWAQPGTGAVRVEVHGGDDDVSSQ